MKEKLLLDFLKAILLDKYAEVQGNGYELVRWKGFLNCQSYEASFSESEILVKAERQGCCSSWPAYLMRIWKENKEIKVSIIPVVE